MKKPSKKQLTTIVKKGKESVKSTAKKGVILVKENPLQAGYVVAGVLGLFLLYKVYTTASNTIDKIIDGDPDINDTVNDTGQGGNSNNTTISIAIATNFASQLLAAMNAKQPFYGTDEGAIEKVFDRLRTKDDFLKVYHVFGEKDYNGNNSPPTGFWSNLDSYKKQNLVYWLKSELDPDEDKIVYNKVANLVNKAGFIF